MSTLGMVPAFRSIISGFSMCLNIRYVDDTCGLIGLLLDDLDFRASLGPFSIRCTSEVDAQC
jgi:hypothetical protein